jgi:hypothetical protein
VHAASKVDLPELSANASSVVEPTTDSLSGYQSHQYAHALSEFGTPVRLPRCGGWLIERSVPDSNDLDAMGSYPIFSCVDWKSLKLDLESLEHAQRVVSVALVADPFADVGRSELEECFDFVRPFKEHFVVDLQEDPESLIPRHHRYYARRSLRDAVVEVCSSPEEHLDEWVSLYDVLIRRHGLRGIRAFSRTSFAQQLKTPGQVLFRMTASGTPLGMHLWFVQGNVAYSHLIAISDAGYANSASYGLYHAAICHFRRTPGADGPVRWLELGAGAGVARDKVDGLTVFKRGWSNATRQAYFCGRIFDRSRYEELSRAKNVSDNGYFPAYRHSEFSSTQVQSPEAAPVLRKPLPR